MDLGELESALPAIISYNKIRILILYYVVMRLGEQSGLGYPIIGGM